MRTVLSPISKWALLIAALVLALPTQVAAEAVSKTNSVAFGGERKDFSMGGHKAFIILPKTGPAGTSEKRPWVWYAPTFAGTLPTREHEWLFSRLLNAGFAIAGVDVGESYGNDAGRKAFTQLHSHLVEEFDLSPKACLLPQSRGGLMLYNWAVEHPDKVQCVAGIYTVCNLASYPGLDKAAPAYNFTPEQLAKHLPEHNPLDRLRPLAEVKVPIFHIHGDADTVVPLEKNAGELVDRYRKLGGPAELVVVPGKGHEVCPEFFESEKLLTFLLSNGGLKPAARVPKTLKP